MSVDPNDPVSSSGMTDYKQCPRFFRYTSLGLFHPVVDKTRSEFGSVIRKAIKKYYRSIKDKPDKKNYLKEIRTTSDNALKQVWKEYGSEMARFLRTANKMMENFKKFEVWRYNNRGTPFRPTVFDKPLYSKRFYALPDVYDRGLVMDWKTGKKQQLTLEYRVDMWIQAEVLEANGFKVDKMSACFLRYNRIVKCNKPNLDWLYKEREELKKSIKANKFTPKYSTDCRRCEYKLRCDYEGLKRSVRQIYPNTQNYTISAWNRPIKPQRILVDNLDL